MVIWAGHLDFITLCLPSNFSCFYWFFSKLTLQKILSGTLSNCQTVWIQTVSKLLVKVLPADNKSTSVIRWYDNLCKLYGPRSGPTICLAWSGSKLFDTLMVFQKVFLKKSYFEKVQQTTKKHSKTCVKWPHSKRPKIGLQEQLSLNAGQKYCRMLQMEHSAILSTFIKLPFVVKILLYANLPSRQWVKAIKTNLSQYLLSLWVFPRSITLRPLYSRAVLLRKYIPHVNLGHVLLLLPECVRQGVNTASYDDSMVVR